MASCLDLITNPEERSALNEDFRLLKQVDKKRPAKDAYIEAAKTRLADHEDLLKQLEAEIVNEFNAKYSPKVESAPNNDSVAELNAGMMTYFNNPAWNNAYVESSLSLSDPRNEIRRAIEGGFNKPVVAIKPTAERFNQLNGISYKNKIYINTESDVGFINITGHELYHQLAKDRPDLHDWFKEQARDYYHDFAAYQDKLNALVGENEKKYGIDAAEEELLADFMGDSFADSKFLTQLAEADGSKFEQLLNAVIKFLQSVKNKLKGLGSEQYISDVEALRKHLAVALVAYANGTEIAGMGDAQFSRATEDKVERLAPNGKPSNLNAVQYKQVRTPEFKKWFGDWENTPENASKVVDANGEPLVMYHGTGADFSEFKLSDKYGFLGYGHYFTSDPDIAAGYGDQHSNSSVMAVFIKSTNPLMEHNINTFEENHYIGDWGFPDMGVENDHDSYGIGDLKAHVFKEMAVLNSNQIKSATGNNGQFDPTNPDIRFSIRQPLNRDRNVKSLQDIRTIIATGRMPQDKFSLQDALDKTATMFVDSSRPFDAAVRDLPRNGELIYAKDRAKRRTADMERTVMDRFLTPMAKVLGDIAKAHKLDYRGAKELAGHWMTARYAIEKNADYIRQDQKAVGDAQDALNNDPNNSELKSALTKAENKQAKRLAAINDPTFVDASETSLEIGLAGGLNNYTAKTIMSEIEAIIPRDKLERTATHVYDMLAYKLEQDLKNGKVTQAVVDTWHNSQFYVPLTGDPSVDDSQDELFSHGSVNQAREYSAEGRAGSNAQNGIDAAVEQVQKSARYHGWVDFKDTLTSIYDELVQNELDAGLTQREAQKAVLETYNLARVPEANASPDAIKVRKNGESWAYEFNNKAAVEALKSVNREDTPSVLQPFAWFTRSSSRMITMLPGFAPVNLIRDVWERSENIRTRSLPGYESLDMNSVGKGALKNAANLGMIKTLLNIQLGRPVDESSQDVKLIREMIAEGATSTMGESLGNTSAKLAEQLRDKLKLTTKAMDAINAYHGAFDMFSTYTVYKSLKDHGVDKKIAASATLNLMNYGKRGTVTGPLQALYMFVNPTMQGGHQLIQSLSTKRGQYRALAYIAAGMVLYGMLRAGDDDDELGVNRLDELGNFSLERNITLHIPGTDEVVKIPVGFGVPQLAWGIAVNVDKVLFGNQTATDAAAEIMKSFARTLAPVAISETSIANHPLVWLTQTLTPQALKPAANIAMGVSAFGAPLSSGFERQDVSRSLQGRRSTPQEYKDIAVQMANLGFNMSPEEVRESMKGYLPGIGNEIIKAWIDNPKREELGRKTSPQLIDRFVLTLDNESLKERLFYRKMDEVNNLLAKQSLGDTLTGEDLTVAMIGASAHKKMNSANGKLAAATKAAKAGHTAKATMYRSQADKLRADAMSELLKIGRK